MSDIRTADPKVLSQEQVEAAVLDDMRLQSGWVKRLQPRVSMLKFRLPWDAGTTPYLKGDIFLPVWGRETTTECRLVVEKDAPEINYDNRKYEEQVRFILSHRVQFSPFSAGHCRFPSHFLAIFSLFRCFISIERRVWSITSTRTLGAFRASITVTTVRPNCASSTLICALLMLLHELLQ